MFNRVEIVSAQSLCRFAEKQSLTLTIYDHAFFTMAFFAAACVMLFQ